MQIRIEEGDGQTYAAGSRATRGITIAVTDAAGNAISGATITLGLPESGPGGVFSNGSKTEILTTRADGRASVWGMKWNRQAGSFEVRVTAAKGQARAGTVVAQHLTPTTGPASAQGGGTSFNRKWLWIALAAGAAGAAVAIATRSGGASGNCSSTVVLSANPCTSTASSTGVTIIGQPTINLGHP